MDGALHNREAEPGAAARRLGGVERLEHPLALLRRHTRPPIRDEHECTWRTGGELGSRRAPRWPAGEGRDSGVSDAARRRPTGLVRRATCPQYHGGARRGLRSEEHTSELKSPCNLVCRLLLEKKKKTRRHEGH